MSVNAGMENDSAFDVPHGLVVTLDVDWAPDFVIDAVAAMLVDAGVRATWFVTHACPAVDRLRQHPVLFELGIHPNFLPGSTHGTTMEEVLRHCLALVPEVQSMRTHGLYQSSPLLHHVSAHTPIDTDVSLMLPRTPHLRPVRYYAGGAPLVRIPYFWEDDVEMEQEPAQWSLASLVDTGPGLKVLDFHPIHVYLNARSMEPYDRVKAAVSDLTKAKPGDVDPYVQTGPGTQSLFREVIDVLRHADSLRIADLKGRIERGIVSSEPARAL